MSGSVVALFGRPVAIFISRACRGWLSMALPILYCLCLNACAALRKQISRSETLEWQTRDVTVQRVMSQHLCRVQQDLVSLHSVVEALLSTGHDSSDCVTLVRALLCSNLSASMKCARQHVQCSRPGWSCCCALSDALLSMCSFSSVQSSTKVVCSELCRSQSCNRFEALSCAGAVEAGAEEASSDSAPGAGQLIS